MRNRMTSMMTETLRQTVLGLNWISPSIKLHQTATKTPSPAIHPTPVTALSLMRTFPVVAVSMEYSFKPKQLGFTESVEWAEIMRPFQQLSVWPNTHCTSRTGFRRNMITSGAYP